MNDLWGNNAGILSGAPEFVEGKFLEALSFDGVDDTVEIPHDVSIDFPDTSFSVEFWFKGSSDTFTVHGYVFGKGFSGGHGKRYEFIILTLPEGSIFVVDDNVVDKSVVAWPDPDRFADEEWHHWMFVRDVEKSELRIYMDGGAEVAIGNDRTKQSISNDNSLWMGRQNPNEPGAKPGHLTGILDEFRIYNRALNDAEIGQNYTIKSNDIAVNHAGKIAISWGKIKAFSAFGHK